MKKLLLVITLISILFSCGKDKQQSFFEEKSSGIYNIKGDEIILREGAGNNYAKLINETASKLLKETQYLSVDNSCKVKIDEEKGDWAKIRVIEPSHLSNTHIGWIQQKYIIKTTTDKTKLEKLDMNLYEIMKSTDNPTVQNFYVLVKIPKFNQDLLNDFTKKFRNEYCFNKQCNINLYDSNTIKSLVDKYPLEKAEYIKVADHYIGMSTFDSTDSVWWYPYQDVKYKEYGGKNWKKKPIK